MNSNLSENPRIKRIRRRYQKTVPQISVQRAKYYTQSWKDTSGNGMSQAVRVAMAMKNVYEKMNHYIDADDRIAGYWTEQFFGIPIDIERGVFNQVFEAELTKKDIISHRGRSLAKALVYMIRKGVLWDFVKNQRAVRSNGGSPLDMSFSTMSQRKINPFQIDKEDLAQLKKDILPFWKNKTMADTLQKQLVESGLFSKDKHDFAVALPGNTSRQVMMLSTCATIATIQRHVILDYEKVLNSGLEKMQKEVAKKRATSPDLTPSQADFLESMEVALEGVTIYSKRLAQILMGPSDSCCQTATALPRASMATRGLRASPLLASRVRRSPQPRPTT